MLEVGSTIKSFALPGNGTGKILKKYVDRKGTNGEDLYEIMDENGEISSMVPSLFDSVVSNSVSIEQIKYEINKAIDKIIKQLDLQESNDVMDQLRNCCLVQKYIVEHNTYDEDIMKKKEGYKAEEIVILDLYNAIVLYLIFFSAVKPNLRILCVLWSVCTFSHENPSLTRKLPLYNNLFSLPVITKSLILMTDKKSHIHHIQRRNDFYGKDRSCSDPYFFL